MSKTLSVSVNPEQYKIIKRIADLEKRSISSILKDSIQMRIVLQYVSELISKVGLEERTMETIERDANIREHSEAIAKLIQPVVEKAISGMNPDVIKALEEEGKEVENTMKIYSKPAKRGRRPALTVKADGDK